MFPLVEVMFALPPKKGFTSKKNVLTLVENIFPVLIQIVFPGNK